MPTYQVDGADRVSGRDTRMFLDAVSENEAKVRAETSLLISGVKAISLHDLRIRDPDWKMLTFASNAAIYAGVALALACILFLAIAAFCAVAAIVSVEYSRPIYGGQALGYFTLSIFSILSGILLFGFGQVLAAIRVIVLRSMI